MKRSNHPAPLERVYTGRRTPNGCLVTYCDGPDRPAKMLNECFDIANHSPTGFEWGYGGSGPAQLALALIVDATGDVRLARAVYQNFKFQVIGPITVNEWTMTAGHIANMARLLEGANNGEAGGNGAGA